MIVGVLQLQLTIFEAMSLKDKRRVIKSLKDRLHHQYNISVAEVDYQDEIRTAMLGVAMVANESRFVTSALSGIVDYVRRNTQVSLVDYTIETF